MGVLTKGSGQTTRPYRWAKGTRTRGEESLRGVTVADRLARAGVGCLLLAGLLLLWTLA
jgi:hypothetical protein